MSFVRSDSKLMDPIDRDSFLQYFDTVKTRYRREIGRAIRVSDVSALQRAAQIRAEASGLRSALLLLGYHNEGNIIKEWLEEIYD